MAHIKFSTDSAADIPVEMREEWDITCLPFPIAMGDRELRDGLDFTPPEFYEMLVAEPKIPTHAQLTPFEFTQFFEEIWKAGYTDLIHTCINSKGSATYQNALSARESFYEDHPEAKDTFHIYIIDSHQYTMGYGWAVVQGAKMAAEGVCAEEIVAYIQDWVDHARVVFIPLNLHYAKKSGRLSPVAAFVGEALGLKPIMTFIDGDTKVLTKARGERNAIAAVVDFCVKQRRSGTPYLLIKGSNAELADKLLDASREALQEDPVLEFYIGGVVSINSGPELIGLVYRV